jgi:hypothetical protein
LLPGEHAGKVIVSTHKSDHLWNLKTGEEELSIVYDDYAVRVWLQHPHAEAHAVCVKQESIHIHHWRDLSEVVSVALNEPGLTGLSVKGAFPCARSSRVLLDLTDSSRSAGTQTVFLLNCGALVGELGGSRAAGDSREAKDGAATQSTLGDTQNDPSSSRIFSLIPLGNIKGRVAHVLGVCHNSAKADRMIFLDTGSRVCSVELEGQGNYLSYTRHFFVPYDWFAGTRCPIGRITSQGDVVVFGKNGDVAVIKGGMEYAETVEASVTPVTPVIL